MLYLSIKLKDGLVFDIKVKTPTISKFGEFVELSEEWHQMKMSVLRRLGIWW